jgi:hypothetical protein
VALNTTIFALSAWLWRSGANRLMCKPWWLAMAQTWSKHAGNGDDVQPSNVIRLNFDRRGTTPALPSATVFSAAPAFRTAAALPKAFVIY